LECQYENQGGERKKKPLLQTRDMSMTYTAHAWKSCRDDSNVTPEVGIWLPNSAACTKLLMREPENYKNKKSQTKKTKKQP
jgi:hypothetical protein